MARPSCTDAYNSPTLRNTPRRVPGDEPLCPVQPLPVGGAEVLLALREIMSVVFTRQSNRTSDRRKVLVNRYRRRVTNESGWRDLNPRPLAPQTTRHIDRYRSKALGFPTNGSRRPVACQRSLRHFHALYRSTCSHNPVQSQYTPVRYEAEDGTLRMHCDAKGGGTHTTFTWPLGSSRHPSVPDQSRWDDLRPSLATEFTDVTSGTLLQMAS